VDRIRIRIWDKNDGDKVFYDNLLPDAPYPGPSDDVDLKALPYSLYNGLDGTNGNGSIQIHSGGK
jgi:hypothetical protein